MARYCQDFWFPSCGQVCNPPFIPVVVCNPPYYWCGRCNVCTQSWMCIPCNPCRPCGRCSKCSSSFGFSPNAFNNPNHVSGFNRRTRSIVVGLEAVEVDVPSEQLSQRSKAVLSEGGFSATSDEHITKFLEAIDMKKMTEEVAALGESLSKEPGTENISGRIIALLRPFFMLLNSTVHLMMPRQHSERARMLSKKTLILLGLIVKLTHLLLSIRS
jgi:hypothetical protein